MKRHHLILICILAVLFLIPTGVFTYKNLFRYETMSILGMEKVLTRTNIITDTVYIRHPETLEWIAVHDFEASEKERVAQATEAAYTESLRDALRQTRERIEQSTAALNSTSLEDKKSVLNSLPASFGVGYGDLEDDTSQELDHKLQEQIKAFEKSAAELETRIDQRLKSTE